MQECEKLMNCDVRTEELWRQIIINIQKYLGLHRYVLLIVEEDYVVCSWATMAQHGMLTETHFVSIISITCFLLGISDLDDCLASL